MKSIALRRLALATAGLTVLTGVALAGGPDQGPGMQDQAMPMNVAEMTRKAQERAAAVDLDKDGFVTPAETRAYREQQREARAAARFAAMDANKDGKVSVAEYSAAHTARIQAMDANGDGGVDRSEMRAAHRHGRHHGGKHGGPDGARCAEAPAG